MFAVISLAIFMPYFSGAATKFSPENYYSLLGSLIGGVITLFALSWQFSVERNKAHEEKKLEARGFYEINYIHSTGTEKFNKHIAQAKCSCELKKHPAPDMYINFKLHGKYRVYDCYVRLKMIYTDSKSNSTKEYCQTSCIGLVVPEQRFVVPCYHACEDFSLTILYRTVLNEVIKHEIIFKHGMKNQAEKEYMSSIACEGMLSENDIEKLFATEMTNIFSSASCLFQYHDS